MCESEASFHCVYKSPTLVQHKDDVQYPSSILFGEVRLELPGISGSGAGQPVHEEEARGQLPVLRVRLTPVTLCVAHLQIEKKARVLRVLK
jgi:hypothetical protein